MQTGKAQDIQYYVQFSNRRRYSSERNSRSRDAYLMAPSIDTGSVMLVDDLVNVKLYYFFWVIPRCLNFMCRRFGTFCLCHFHRSCEQEEGNKGKVVLVHFMKAYGRLEVFHLFVTSALDKGEWYGQPYVRCTRARESCKPNEYELRRSIEVVWRLVKLLAVSGSYLLSFGVTTEAD